ncbi:MAG: sulfite exporter TauE/SafE family protein [Magnetospirillum gryphiswaldense]|nr:sulfite exporter TauE/SafE family protein [Magnetospirillum gryphiswaldense]
MDLAIVIVAAATASLLTLFSGFGLGTILLPVFVLFLPVPAAIASVAVVHFANNLFKLALLGRHADGRVVLLFGGPAMLAAFAGAAALGTMAGLPDLVTYELGGRQQAVTPLKLVIGVLMITFAGLELSPRLADRQFDRRWMPLGGVLSGFVGGLSGMQGALRSAFLAKTGLTKEAFVATGVVCAAIVDISRLAVYGLGFLASSSDPWTGDAWILALAGTFAAFLGAWLGTRLLAKVTYRTVKRIVAIGVAALGLALAAGLV